MSANGLKLAADTEAIRPSSLEQIVGMESIKETLKYDLVGAFRRNDRYPHFILSSPPGLGKTTLAHIISKLLKSTVHRIMGAGLSKPEDVYDLAGQCEQNDVVFIEEAHGIRKRAADILKPWMEEGVLVGDKSLVNNAAPNVVFVLASTNIGSLDEALRNRCRIIQLDYYTIDEIKKIIIRAADVQGFVLNDAVALDLLAQSSRGTPRTAIEQRLQRVLNIMVVDHVPFTEAIVRRMFEMNGIQENGLEKHDITYCNKLYEVMSKTNGRPASLDTMCKMTGFSRDVVLNTIESYLLHVGAIMVNTKGRSLTDFGLEIINKEKEFPQMADNTVVAKIASPINSIDVDVLRGEIESNEIRNMRDLCNKYKLRYGPDNVLVKNLLETMGYTVKRRAGIVPL